LPVKNTSQFQQPITVTDEDEKAITEFDLTDLFDDLEKNAYNAEYHNYNYKQANQIIRKHFEALSLKAQKAQPEDKPDISKYPNQFQNWVRNNIVKDYDNDYLAFLFSMYDKDYDTLKT
jgi:hypothetical protein